MAALNTLRTKGGVLLAVVIGISLLAFLLGDLATSGGTLFNSARMSVGEINGEKVSYQEYLSKIEQLNLVQQIITGNDALTEEQSQAVRATAWEQLMRGLSFDESLENLGLTVSDQESIDMVEGEFVSPIITSLFTNPQDGMFDKNLMRNYIATLDDDASGRKRFFWNYIESEMLEDRAMSKYMALVEQGIFVNDLEVEQGVAANDNYYNVKFVAKPLSSVPDSLIKVSDADMRSYYDKHRRLFKQTDSREINYVVFDALPSDKDYEDAAAYVKTLAEELKATEDIQQYVKLNSQMPFNAVYLKASELPEGLRDFAFKSSPDSVYGPVLENDVYTIARVIDVKQYPDTVGARQILLSPTDTKLADSLYNVLSKNTADFAALANQYSVDKQSAGGDLGKLTPALIGTPELADFTKALLETKQGEVVKVTTPYGIHIVEVTYRGPLFPKALVGTVIYSVDPSDETQQIAFSKAAKFTDAVSGKNADFDKVVNEEGISKRVARLRAGDNAISGINQSQEVVRWAFNAKEGDVSDVISIGESNLVAKVIDVREHGEIPFDKVKEDIRPEVLREKKIEYVANEMSGASSLDELAGKLGTEVKEAAEINFNSFYVPEMGVAPRVIGAITALPENTLSKPIAGGVDVVVTEVVGKENRNETDAAQERVVLQTNAETEVVGRVYNAVFGLADIKDTRIKFF